MCVMFEVIYAVVSISISLEQSEQSERYTIRRLFLPSVNSYGGGRGVVVYLLDYDVREISSDVREILSTFSFYTTPVFYFILLPTYIFFL